MFETQKQIDEIVKIIVRLVKEENEKQGLDPSSPQTKAGMIKAIDQICLLIGSSIAMDSLQQLGISKEEIIEIFGVSAPEAPGNETVH